MYYPKNSERVVVPAEPGWRVAWPGDGYVTTEPVIAWMIVHSLSDHYPPAPDDRHLSAFPYPITPDGLETLDSCAILSPDGTFHIPNDSISPNETQFLKRWAEIHPPREIASPQNPVSSQKITG